MPQVLINCRVSARKELTEIPGYQTLINQVEAQLNGKGRVFVRFSGTEPVIRILVEGADRRLITTFAQDIAEFLQNHLAS